MQTAKEQLQQLVNHLPDNATLNDVMYELYVRQKLERSLQAAKEGHVTSHEEAKQRILGHAG